MENKMPNNSLHLTFFCSTQNDGELCPYLGDPDEIAKAAEAVVAQGKAK